MSQYDDDFQSVFDDRSFTEKPNLEEILGNPSLRAMYGYDDIGKNDFLIPNSVNLISDTIEVKTAVYFLVPQAIVVALILGFTFIF